MSARGSLVSSPTQRSSKLLSESKRYIPLLWLALIPADAWDPNEEAVFELDRKEAIARAQQRLPFLVKVFSNVTTFEATATALLDRLSSLQCKSIGIDIAELVTPEPPNPDLGVALATIENRNEAYSLSLPAYTEENPFTGESIERPAREISSTRELLLQVSWLTQRELDSASAEEVADYITGYMGN